MLEFKPPTRDIKPSAIKKSMYTSVVDNGDGNYLLHNTLTGFFLKVPASAIRFLLESPQELIPISDLNPFQALLFKQGFLVPAESDEYRRSRMLYDSRFVSRRRLELILLPHENCNFRCTYCYEVFARNKMESWVRDAIKKFVFIQAEDFKELAIAWFGGEPTLAVDVIHELSTFFIDTCRQNGARYAAQITTNGFRLSDEVARKLILDCKISQFQITLDGTPEEHDKRRHLAGGGSTFARIYDNLLNMRSINAPFKVIIRINFDSENAQYMDSFTERIARDFAQDPRFIVHFFPISEWGGTGDGALPICDVNVGRLLKYQLLESAVDRGFSSRIRDEIEPMGTACYAADPNSYIIGADGKIYKCTVAFEDPRNQVGIIRPDGSMEIDIDRFGLWVVNDGVDDANCRSCFFNPSCHGMSCPLYRMETHQSPCPTVKQSFPQALRILAKETSKNAGNDA